MAALLHSFLGSILMSSIRSQPKEDDDGDNNNNNDEGHNMQIIDSLSGVEERASKSVS